MPKQEEVKVVPPRNDPNPLEPYAKSQALQIKGTRPGFVQQWVRADQIPHYTSRHEIGDQFTGYLMVEPWQVVQQGEVQTGRPMDAQGQPTDTTVNNGELWLIETPEQNAAKYKVIETKRQALIERRLVGGEKHGFGSKTSFKTRTLGGREGYDATTNDVLNGV